MKLTTHGTIKSDDYNIRRTGDDRWLVSRRGTVIGYTDTLDEIPDLIAHYKTAVRARLAEVEAKAAALKTEMDEMPEEIARATLKD